MRREILLLLTLVFAAVTGTCATAHAGESLLVFAGAASKPPTEEAARAFEKKKIGRASCRERV